MIVFMQAMLLVAENPAPLDKAIEQATNFLKMFAADPKSVSELSTGDALFATIDGRGPLAEVIKQSRGQEPFLKGCTLSAVTAKNIEREALNNLPANMFKKEDMLVAAEGAYSCIPNGKMMKAQALLVIKNGKVAFFGIYPTREP